MIFFQVRSSKTIEKYNWKSRWYQNWTFSRRNMTFHELIRLNPSVCSRYSLEGHKHRPAHGATRCNKHIYYVYIYNIYIYLYIYTVHTAAVPFSRIVPVPVHLHSPLSVQRKKESCFYAARNFWATDIEPFVTCALPIENRGSVAPIPADLVHTSQRPFKYSMPLQDEVVAHLEPPGIPSQSSQWKFTNWLGTGFTNDYLTDSFGFDAGPFQVI